MPGAGGASANETRLVIVTGLSGAGKTQAIRALEDLGYYCVDNLPPLLVPKLAELLGRGPGRVDRIALVMDIRGGEFFVSLVEVLGSLKKSDFPYEVLFLEASVSTLVRRFKETRRRHPLSLQGGILENIEEEKRQMHDLRELADKIIDTTELSPQQLQEQLQNLYGEEGLISFLITIISFGFKYGIPLDADLVMDVRFLPNPHYSQELRPLMGWEQEIKDFVFSSPLTLSFMERFAELLMFLLPYYKEEGKSQLVVALGCTGGRHRSVALAEELGKKVELPSGFRILVKHRDAVKGPEEGGRW